MKWRPMLAALGSLAGLVGCTAGEPLRAVSAVDIQRYMGKWYEIAAYEAPFAESCTGTTAEYTLRDDGRFDVVNSCREGQLDGPVRAAIGTARVVDAETRAKLKVSFVWPFEGDYWIIDLDPEYQWAVVGEPGRRYLWILSRTATMDEPVYQGITTRLEAQGYDPSKLHRTLQRP
ncbi:MAG TPA: lipocalin family protein [Phycisphaerae bacterium]|nr:lipocalin family protein [Phycisphaerae bacterium]